jgi:phosphate transport system protein
MYDELGPQEASVARGIEEAALHGGVETREPLRRATRGALDEDERAIKDTLLRMGSLIEVAILDTVAALEEHDAAKALVVIEGDERINELMHEAVDAILVAIATQQPVARDLRLLLTLDHVAYELERIGDNAANVAKRARELAPQAPLEGHVGLPEMGRLAADVLADVTRALVDSDPDLARSVAARDDLIDRHYHRAQADLARLAKADPANVDRAALLLISAHYFERIGDRVTNIAEDVVFLSTSLVEDLNP